MCAGHRPFLLPTAVCLADDASTPSFEHRGLDQTLGLPILKTVENLISYFLSHSYFFRRSKHRGLDQLDVKMFWREVKLITGMKLPSLHPISWASDLLMDGLCNDRERGIFIIGMYALWMQRNQRQHGDTHKPVSATVRWSLDTAIDLWNLNKPMNSVEEQCAAMVCAAARLVQM